MVHAPPQFMKKYQVKKYFDLGSLKFEPLQYLDVNQSDVEDCFVISKDGTEQKIIVSKKAFQNQLNLGRIVEDN